MRFACGVGAVQGLQTLLTEQRREERTGTLELGGHFVQRRQHDVDGFLRLGIEVHFAGRQRFQAFIAQHHHEQIGRQRSLSFRPAEILAPVADFIEALGVG
ncbi:hypothetical protein [Accumulibacter sp.]|uniref:hypothetical protein n=1 Tax=Accumulibacter sp. TaxID=2053492 RepID=UPI0028C46D6B|nr:hypothetical protein [Accumulibacter sp.]